MNINRKTAIIGFAIASLSLTTGTVAEAGGGHGRHEHKGHSLSAKNCSALLARTNGHGRSIFRGRLHRQCVIEIASTYLIDGLQNKDADAVLLTDDAYRTTVGQGTRTGAEEIREIIRNGGEDAVGQVTNIQWTVEGNEAWTIWDGIFPGDTKPGFFVSERFTIRDGKISEIVIGGVQFAPDLCETEDPCL